MAKLKRYLAPKFWKIPKKVYTWTVSPRPGPHKKFESLPLQIIVRDMLKLVEAGKEAKLIISKGEVLVNRKPRKDHAYPVGLFDSISIPKIQKFYRVIPTSKGLDLSEISETEAEKKICRIDDKKILKNGRIQLNLNDGTNILVENNDYKTGDSVLLELPTFKILEHLKLVKGSSVMITRGKNAGKLAKIKDFSKTKLKQKLICEIGGKDFEVDKEALIVLNKDKSLISRD